MSSRRSGKSHSGQTNHTINHEIDVLRTIPSSTRYVVPDRPNNFSSDAPKLTLRDSLRKINLSTIDIYLVHGHTHARSIASVAASLASCVDKGMTKAVGVANHSSEDLLQMRDGLAKYGVPLALNQVGYSVFRRLPETTRLVGDV